MPVTFTQKEIELMPKNFKSYFIENNTVITYRIVKNVYQARYRKNGINIEVASKDFNAMKQKMLERLNDTFTRNSSASTKQFLSVTCQEEVLVEEKTYPTFESVANEWLELRKRKNKESTL